MAKETVYVIGHKSPDTDTVCSAIAYAEFLKKKKIDAVAAIPEDLNPETKYVLDFFNSFSFTCFLISDNFEFFLMYFLMTFFA